MKQVLLLLLFLLIPLQVVYAQEILFSVEQSDYYFKVGEDAVIPVQINNGFGKQVPGMLQYSITQQINQGNFQFSNSKTNSNSFMIRDGNGTVSLNFGTSNDPTTLVVNLNFNYNEGKEQTSSLGPITIHFVSDESQKNNQSNPMQSTTQNTPPNQQDPLSQQRQQMQQRLDQMLGNQQMLPQDPQQRLQNNQMSQDSSALKQQMQQQLQQQEQTQKEFEKQLAANSEFSKQHNQLLQKGYNVTSSNIEPVSNSTGSFEVQYKNEDGKWATLQGQMNNGTVTEIKQQSQEQQEKLLEKLKQSKQYQEFDKQLTTNGFSQKNIEFQQDENKTSIVVEYQDKDQNKATITGIFENEQIKSVTLNKNSSFSFDLSWIIAIIISVIVASVVAFFFAKKLLRKKPMETIPVPKKHTSKPFDYLTESKKMMSKAQQHYSKEEYKDAFGIAGQAIRLFLSYNIGQKREMTNKELIQIIPEEKYPVNEISECLKMTEVVEFAKAESTEEDFARVVSLFEKLTRQN